MDHKLKIAHAKLDESIAVHKEHPETRNHHFTDRYNALQQENSEAEIRQILVDVVDTRNKITEDDIPQLRAMLREKETAADMDLVAAESTFNAMEAFYKVAMKLFVNNVPNLVVRAIIASYLPSIFCPKNVFAMDPDLVTKIVSETEDKRGRRREISGKLKALEAGNDLCKQYALRVTSGQSVAGLVIEVIFCCKLSKRNSRRWRVRLRGI